MMTFVVKENLILNWIFLDILLHMKYKPYIYLQRFHSIDFTTNYRFLILLIFLKYFRVLLRMEGKRAARKLRVKRKTKENRFENISQKYKYIVRRVKENRLEKNPKHMN